MISQYGTVIDFRNEHTVIDNGRTPWRSGTRLAFVTSLNAAIPPGVKLNLSGKDFSVWVWHFGQTHMKCRWCHNVVEKHMNAANAQYADAITARKATILKLTVLWAGWVICVVIKTILLGNAHNSPKTRGRITLQHYPPEGSQDSTHTLRTTIHDPTVFGN